MCKRPWNFLCIFNMVALSGFCLVGCPWDGPKPPIGSNDVICEDFTLALTVYGNQAPEKGSLANKEDPPILTPDIDSFIGRDHHPSASYIDFSDDDTEGVEGVSKKSIIRTDGDEWVVWFVQAGLNGTTDTKNMVDYAGGYLSFWTKSSINLEVGIRSGNVQPGQERSKIVLTDGRYGFATDNTWNRIKVPIADLVERDTRLDLSRMKILFSIAVNTPTGGTQGEESTFWIDEVQWAACSP